jgi:hypothetical protein
MSNEPEDEDCGTCGGEGYITNVCFEDTCCCANSDIDHGLIRCPDCSGTGGTK